MKKKDNNINKVLAYCDVLLGEIIDYDNKKQAIAGIITQDYLRYSLGKEYYE